MTAISIARIIAPSGHMLRFSVTLKGDRHMPPGEQAGGTNEL
ncbi:hypothetical protein AB0894_06485 [Streptomyces sp. NPDC047916]